MMTETGIARWEPQKPVLGSVNALLIAQSCKHYVNDFPGPLSIKTVIEGRVAWRVEQRGVWVDDLSFLVLNDGEPYSMEIDFPEPVTTCCTFFQQGFVESVSSDLAIPLERRLQDPGQGHRPLSFLSRLHPRSDRLLAVMARVKQQVLADYPAISLDECFLDLAFELLLHYEETKKQMGRIPAVRASTRSELFARAARGREFLHAEFGRQVTLAEAARIACLSPFHFQRTFARAFGKSPSRYVNELRLAKAVRLLKSGRLVTDVCFEVGFESLGSFSTTFRKHYGVPPSSLRP